MIHPNKFEVGDTVYETTRPHQLMVITRRKGFMCYCSLLEDKNHEIVFMERDLKKEMKHPHSPQVSTNDNTIHHQS